MASGGNEVFKEMERWCEIRRRVLVEGVSKREILRETGLHWRTLEKILAHSKPPGYRMKKTRPKPKLGPFLPRIEEILREDQEESIPKKQRHTAKRIYERIRAEGYQGGYSVVQEAVKALRERNREVFVPLSHRPGEAQVDFGYALVRVAGVLRKVAFFVMTLPYSDAMFVMAFERECTETFWEGHVRAFSFFGGVPTRITYDNTTVAVANILGAHKRKLTDGFLQLQSHYLFDHHFCRVRRANEKGVVESCVKYIRLNYFVPVPQVKELAELNEALLRQCREDLNRRVRGKEGTKGVLLEGDREAFLPLPVSPFDTCRKVSTQANSLSLVRFDGNDYSVPVRYAHHPIVAKGYVDRVVLCYHRKVVATHKRIWEKENLSFDPIHYLALLERKPGALEHARPLENWDLPPCFGVLRRRLEQEREGGDGTREYIRVLRLLEKHSLRRLGRAVERALRVHGYSRDAVAQFLYGEEVSPVSRFRLDGRDHLKRVRVEMPQLPAYQSLLSGGVE
jgi:transposase